jgi:nucleotide-binding universal stress UspA family protein
VFERVIAGIDGSPVALQAASLGARLAALGGGAMELVSVVELGRDLAAAHLPFGEEFLARHRKRCEEHLAAARHLLPGAPLANLSPRPGARAARSPAASGEGPPPGSEGETPEPGRAHDLADASLPPGTRITFGPPAGELLAVVDEARADLLCVGAGQHALPLGSVSAAVARRARIPVLVARSGARGRLARLVVGYDGSDPAARAVTVAATVAREAGAGLWVVRVASRSGEGAPDLTRARQLAEATGARLEDLREELGDPADRLLAAADETSADLLVIGARGRSKIARWLLGGTSDKLVAHAPRAVLVVR